MEDYPIEITIKQGNVYYMPADKAILVEKVGTDASSDARLWVADQHLGWIHSQIAPLTKSSSNVLGPLDLKDWKWVIPPKKKFYIEGPSGCKFRLIGKMFKLGIGESLPSDVLDFFNKQFKEYLTHIASTTSLGTDVKLLAGNEATIFSLTPLTKEQYLLSFPLQVGVSNYTPSWGDLALIPYERDNPRTWLTESPGFVTGGIDILSCPRPPTDSANKDIFSFERKPWQLSGDVNYKINVRNVKGADIAPASGTSLTFYLDTIAVYKVLE